jgi:uncharacterized protein YukE
MSDPLADSRARDLLTADPADLGALAAVFRTAAAEAHQTEAGLRAAQHDGVWTGKAATAFRHAIGRLPAELDKVRSGFQGVSEALLAYESELSRIKPAFASVVAELENAQSRLGPAHAAADAAVSALLSAARSRHATVSSLTSAELAVGRAEGAVAGLQAEVGRLARRAFALLDEFSSAREACRQAIAVASRTAPPRPLAGHGITVIGFTPVLERQLRSWATLAHPMGL